ncbi:SDR family NAD(P)-dependent oxidoreductase [Rhizobium rhizogenes]|uniref:SDR family NAD(P)-dependent oxidoreductase n=1 Tax=Rhizobium rhizogenes TaxID=359 RepID=UPI001574575F|nr:SDR family NAD(P)-dependent oxidoreductase [Rhizobium rhizogenes]NTI78493.1 SDR family oxidoreductase [Rhizobium rhizogenes]
MAHALKGLVAVVTGGAGGIGSATCRVLAERGASVAVADLDGERAQAVAEAINAGGGKAIGLSVDIGDEASIVAMFTATLKVFGRLDIIDNNAALLTQDYAQRDLDIARMETQVWDRTFQVNTRGTMLCCREALKIMEVQGSGVIINTASNLALQGNVIQAAYSASKAAVIQLTRSIATSHGRRGIRCNAVLPGLTGSKAALENLPPRLREIVKEETLTPYLGDPIDIAFTVAFLASAEARYITGQTIVADGGTSVHIPGYARLNDLFNGAE